MKFGLTLNSIIKSTKVCDCLGWIITLVKAGVTPQELVNSIIHPSLSGNSSLSPNFTEKLSAWWFQTHRSLTLGRLIIYYNISKNPHASQHCL